VGSGTLLKEIFMGDLREESENKRLDEIGGEPLEGSGFENETPDPSFAERRFSKKGARQ
jgi:hypothetical protein